MGNWASSLLPIHFHLLWFPSTLFRRHCPLSSTNLKIVFFFIQMTCQQFQRKLHRKLQDAQAKKLTTLQAENLTSWQIDNRTNWQNDEFISWQIYKLPDGQSTRGKDNMTIDKSCQKMTKVSKSCKKVLKVGNYVKSCQKMLNVSKQMQKNCQNMQKLSKLVNSCQKFPNTARSCQILSKEKIPKGSKSWHRLSNDAKRCPRMP